MKRRARLIARACAAVALAAALTAGTGRALPAQPDAPRLRGTVERIKVHGPSLEGNLSGDSPDRDVSIYLPPSYRTEISRRYPVIYALHGFTDDDLHWMGFTAHFVNLSALTDRAITARTTPELIVVMPNSYTRFQGSMYSNSITTGYWEDFVVRDLVAHVDAHYRTLADVASRGLAGHSMGGYGALRIGMKYPDVYSSVYVLSPCCMAPRLNTPQATAGLQRAEAITTMEEFARADFGTRALLASAAAWAPNPKNPPFFLDLPTKNGEPQPQVLAKFAANAPLALIDQYVGNLNRLEAFAVDAGNEDRGIAAASEELHEILTRYGVAHEFEIYPGNHTNRVAERIEQKMLPFFARHLSFGPARR